MRRVILTYGLIAGVIVSIMILGSIPLWENGILTFDNGEIVGYTTIVIALSMVFFGIKSCRDYHFRGSITFWQGVKVGLLITLIASVMYALAWEVSYHTTDINDKMWQHYVDAAKSEGGSEVERSAAVAEREKLRDLYQNPLMRFPMTLVEIFPVGVLITLISAAVLRRKEVLPV